MANGLGAPFGVDEKTSVNGFFLVSNYNLVRFFPEIYAG